MPAHDQLAAGVDVNRSLDSECMRVMKVQPSFFSIIRLAGGVLGYRTMRLIFWLESDGLSSSRILSKNLVPSLRTDAKHSRPTPMLR